MGNSKLFIGGEESEAHILPQPPVEDQNNRSFMTDINQHIEY